MASISFDWPCAGSTRDTICTRIRRPSVRMPRCVKCLKCGKKMCVLFASGKNGVIFCLYKVKLTNADGSMVLSKRKTKSQPRNRNPFWCETFNDFPTEHVKNFQCLRFEVAQCLEAFSILCKTNPLSPPPHPPRLFLMTTPTDLGFFENRACRYSGYILIKARSCTCTTRSSPGRCCPGIS